MLNTPFEFIYKTTKYLSFKGLNVWARVDNLIITTSSLCQQFIANLQYLKLIPTQGCDCNMLIEFLPIFWEPDPELVC